MMSESLRKTDSPGYEKGVLRWNLLSHSICVLDAIVFASVMASWRKIVEAGKKERAKKRFLSNLASFVFNVGFVLFLNAFKCHRKMSITHTHFALVRFWPSILMTFWSSQHSRTSTVFLIDLCTGMRFQWIFAF